MESALGHVAGYHSVSKRPSTVTLELVDFVDPGLRGVLSELSVEGRGPKGDLQIHTSSPAICLTSEKHGTVEFPGHTGRVGNPRIIGTLSSDMKRITGFFLQDRVVPAYQQLAFDVTKK